MFDCWVQPSISYKIAFFNSIVCRNGSTSLTCRHLHVAATTGQCFTLMILIDFSSTWWFLGLHFGQHIILKHVVEELSKEKRQNNLTKSSKITCIMEVMFILLWLMIDHCIRLFAYMRIQACENVTVYQCVSSVYNSLLSKSTLKSLISTILTLVAFMCSKYICISVYIYTLKRSEMLHSYE